MKILFFLLDGLGDLPCKKLNGKTPLEYAKTKTFNELAKNGSQGLLIPSGLGREVPIASASLMLFSNFGYDVREFVPKRGLVEAIGAGLKIREGNLCARCNFSTVDENWVIKDIRAGRIKNTKPLEKTINKIDFEVPFEFKSTVNYRGILVFKPKQKLSDKISVVDPHVVGKKMRKAKPLVKGAKYSAYLVNKFLEEAHNVLKEHPFNKNRRLPANFLLPRGFGSSIPKLKPFKKKHGLKAVGLTGLDVNKGVCKLIGMDLIHVPEEIGGKKEFKVKRKPIKKALKKYDFVFVHFKNTDDPGHDGDVFEKVRQIELTDKFIGSLDLEDKFIVITSDHCTPCSKKSHSTDPIPTLISSTGNKNQKFGERYCKDFKMPSHKLMDLVKAFR